MNRRELPGLAATGALVGASGCLATVKSTVPFLGGCPDPGLENEVPYEKRDVRGFLRPSGGLADLRGSLLIPDRDALDELEDVRFHGPDRQWISDTDFAENVVVVLGVYNSYQEDDPEILAVGRDDETLLVRSCVPNTSYHDDATYHHWLLRVSHDGDPPESVELTHWREDEILIEESE